MSTVVTEIRDFVINVSQAGQKAVIGLDIGYSGIKMCFLEKSGKGHKLLNFVYSPLPHGAITEDEVHNDNIIIEAINAAYKEMRTNIKSVCYGLSGPKTMTKRLSVPSGTKEELEDNIIWESQQYIPFDQDDAIVQFDVIGEMRMEESMLSSQLFMDPMQINGKKLLKRLTSLQKSLILISLLFVISLSKV